MRLAKRQARSRLESNGMGRVFGGEGQEREKGREGSKHKQTEPGLRGETGNTTMGRQT